MAEKKNWIHGPFETKAPPGMEVPGLGFGVWFVADCPEGGWLQIVNGPNPLGQPVPGVQINKGQMLALVPAEVAERIRGYLEQVEQKQRDEYAKRMLRGVNGG